MRKLSAVVITLNEERNIARCLESLKGVVDEVIVVDSASTDQTEAICKSYNVQFVQHTWVNYSDQKNFGNSLAANDCILSVDADEELSSELRQSIIFWKGDSQSLAAEFNRLTNYCGHWVRHCGWYPDTKIRLFNRQHAHWQGAVHEQLVFNSKINISNLHGDLLHYSYYTVEEHDRQIEKYSDIAAKELLNNGVRSNNLKIFFKAFARFVKVYFIRAGFLDGPAGWIIAKKSAKASYLRYLKLKNFHRNYTT